MGAADKFRKPLFHARVLVFWREGAGSYRTAKHHSVGRLIDHRPPMERALREARRELRARARSPLHQRLEADANTREGARMPKFERRINGKVIASND